LWNFYYFLNKEKIMQPNRNALHRNKHLDGRSFAADEAIPEGVDDRRDPNEQTQNDVDDHMLVADAAMEEDGQRRQENAEEHLDQDSDNVGHLGMGLGRN